MDVSANNKYQGVSFISIPRSGVGMLYLWHRGTVYISNSIEYGGYIQEALKDISLEDFLRSYKERDAYRIMLYQTADDYLSALKLEQGFFPIDRFIHETTMLALGYEPKTENTIRAYRYAGGYCLIQSDSELYEVLETGNLENGTSFIPTTDYSIERTETPHGREAVEKIVDGARKQAKIATNIEKRNIAIVQTIPFDIRVSGYFYRKGKEVKQFESLMVPEDRIIPMRTKETFSFPPFYHWLTLTIGSQTYEIDMESCFGVKLIGFDLTIEVDALCRIKISISWKDNGQMHEKSITLEELMKMQ